MDGIRLEKPVTTKLARICLCDFTHSFDMHFPELLFHDKKSQRCMSVNIWTHDIGKDQLLWPRSLSWPDGRTAVIGFRQQKLKHKTSQTFGPMADLAACIFHVRQHVFSPDDDFARWPDAVPCGQTTTNNRSQDHNDDGAGPVYG